MYKKCIVEFGKTICISVENNIFEQTSKVQEAMEMMRKELWAELGIVKGNIFCVDKDIYLNHLYLKKYKAIGFKYNSAHESQFLLEKENEYCVDKEGNFIPGILAE